MKIYIEVPLTQRQQEVIIGGMLGDGCASKNDNNWEYIHSQSFCDHHGVDKLTYMTFLSGELGQFCRAMRKTSLTRRPKNIAGKLVSETVEPYHAYRLESRACPQVSRMVKEWYVPMAKSGWKKWRKVIPPDLKLTPLVATLWYMDDGWNYAKDAQAHFATQCFTEDEVIRLCELLKSDLSIDAVKFRPRKNKEQFCIRIGRKSYFDFIDMVRSEMKWDCFKYKVDSAGYRKKAHRGEDHEAAKLTEANVLEIRHLAAQGKPLKELATQFGVVPTLICTIVSGKRWSHVAGPIRKPQTRQRCTEDQTRQILELADLSHAEIAELVGVSQATVGRQLRKVS